MIDPGKMRHRICFENYVGDIDGYGDPQLLNDDNWTDYCATWAAINPISGREFYAAEQSQSEVTHKIICRYRAGLSTAMRIRCGERRFRIISIINWEERCESLLIMAKELVR